MRKIQPVAEVAKAVQARFPHYCLDLASYEKKGLPATWRCTLHNQDFRATASNFLHPGAIGCPECVEERALQKRKRMRADPGLQRNIALITEHLGDEYALIYRLRCEGVKLKDIGAEFGINEQAVYQRLAHVARKFSKIARRSSGST